ncbi:hypothetical protein [Paenibacillus donghaensis]|uniref:Uncharacterized protein n=1 Tax=Paenibacillus donghaensis TaxID=414771 RepID=A0A2Z2K6J0_9BACL|nr:hypothetical protein [Paenibacillus donghaensis]ASA21796.1 hypothetical protein B9T62_14060 [Paenibacillus donghaensis]
MNAIQICYDLKDGNEADYQKVIQGISYLGKVEHVQYSVWIVSTPLTPERVRDHLSSYIRTGDSLFVSQINAYATRNIPVKATRLIDGAWNQPKLVVKPPQPIPPMNQPYFRIR